MCCETYLVISEIENALPIMPLGLPERTLSLTEMFELKSDSCRTEKEKLL